MKKKNQPRGLDPHASRPRRAERHGVPLRLAEHLELVHPDRARVDRRVPRGVRRVQHTDILAVRRDYVGAAHARGAHHGGARRFRAAGLGISAGRAALLAAALAPAFMSKWWMCGTKTPIHCCGYYHCMEFIVFDILKDDANMGRA
jgi:hypothetical protein